MQQESLPRFVTISSYVTPHCSLPNSGVLLRLRINVYLCPGVVISSTGLMESQSSFATVLPMEHFTCLVQQNQGFEVRRDTWGAGDREETLLEGDRDSFVSKRSLLWTLRSERFQLSGEAAETSPIGGSLSVREYRVSHLLSPHSITMSSKFQFVCIIHPFFGRYSGAWTLHSSCDRWIQNLDGRLYLSTLQPSSLCQRELWC